MFSKMNFGESFSGDIFQFFNDIQWHKEPAKLHAVAFVIVVDESIPAFLYICIFNNDMYIIVTAQLQTIPPVPGIGVCEQKMLIFEHLTLCWKFSKLTLET